MIEVARLYRMDNGSAVKGFCDITISGEVLVKGIRIIEGKNGLFAVLPKIQSKDGKWYPQVLLLSDELKNQLQEVVLEAYQV